MKKVRLFSVAVALVAVLVVSAWAGSTSWSFGMLNIQSVPGYSNAVCRTFTGPSNSYMTKIIIRGTPGISSGCVAKYYLQLLYQDGSTQQLIKEIEITSGTGYYEFLFPPNTYPANKTYCIRLRVELVASTVPMCAATFSGGSITFNWSP